jgi:hypothetical protein
MPPLGKSLGAPYSVSTNIAFNFSQSDLYQVLLSKNQIPGVPGKYDLHSRFPGNDKIAFP